MSSLSRYERDARALKLLLLAVVAALMSTACGRASNDSAPPGEVTAPSDSTTENCRMIQHEMSETEVCGQPQRIVVLGPYALESLLAVGVQPVAYADYVMFRQGDYDDPGQQIPYLGRRITQPLINVGTSSSPSIEAVLKSQPDLILGTEEHVAGQYETLSDIAPTLLLSLEEPEQNLRTIAQAVNRSEQAEQVLRATEQQIAAARETFAPLVEAHPKLLLLLSSELPTIYLGNQTGLCSSLMEALGFELVSFPESSAAAAAAPQSPISLETLPQLNEADSIILLGANASPIQQFDTMDEFGEHQLSTLQPAWEANAVAQSLDASQAGRVYFIPYYMCAGLPGPIGTELYLNELKTQLLSDQD